MEYSVFDCSTNLFTPRGLVLLVSDGELHHVTDDINSVFVRDVFLSL